MRPTRNRAGFTLVELLVVMTIIAILFALTAAAVTRALVKADETKTRNEISQLANAVQAFKQEFQVAYLPSRITLPPGCDTSGQSSQYISSLWPRITPAYVQVYPSPSSVPAAVFAYWGVPQSQFPNGYTLTGDQCLVFFLGGVRDGGNNPIGFATSPTDPLSQPTTPGATGATKRKGPFYEFPPSRLVNLPNPSSPTGLAPFQSFVDVYGANAPYLYFSSAKAGNDYPAPAATFYNSPTGSVTQISTLPFYSFIEYANSTKSVVNFRFANPNSFQIIAAGRDGQFGDGGENWPGATVKYDSPGTTSPGATSQTGYDDMSNFHPTLLGVPNQ